jgi:ribose 1,5-bisphosphate isomerase
MNEDVRHIGQDIASMRIRGAGRIAVAAAEALAIAAQTSNAATYEELKEDVRQAAAYLVAARPTAVSLPNAVRFVLVNGTKGGAGTVETYREAVQDASRVFVTSATEALSRIGAFGARRIKDGDKVMTVCNSNAAIEVMRQAYRDGREFEVFAMETRPWFQGRLTARALAAEGIPVNLIVDSAARFFMKDMDHLITGADAITANGAVVNKIGTATASLAAHEARVRVMVAAETYKFHPDTMAGELVEIEERDEEEVLPAPDAQALSGVRVRNPVFDITPPEYVDIIVTERGIIPPQASFFLLTELFGWRITDRDPWER